MPLSTLQASPRGDTCKTQGQDGVAFSFPAGLSHPLQHAGLARRTPRVLDALPGEVLERFDDSFTHRLGPAGHPLAATSKRTLGRLSDAKRVESNSL